MRKNKIISLPKPNLKGKISIEETIEKRITIRNFIPEELNKEIISQLLWALQGKTQEREKEVEGSKYHRGAPSAGKTYPLRVYTLTNIGLYFYKPDNHELKMISNNDLRKRLSKALITELNQDAVKIAPLTIVLCMNNLDMLQATPILEKALCFSHLEAGHATQTLILQATAFGLGSCTITSFNINAVYKALKLSIEERPIYIIPIGYPKRE